MIGISRFEFVRCCMPTQPKRPDSDDDDDDGDDDDGDDDDDNSDDDNVDDELWR